MSTSEKICRKCKQTKPSADFGRRKIAADGMKSWCKACEAEAARRRQIESRDHVREINRRSAAKNREKRHAQTASWRERNAEHVAQYRKDYRSRPEVKEKRRLAAEQRRRALGVPVRTKEPYEETLRKACEAAKIYYRANKDKVRVYKRQWMRDKMATDIQYKLKLRLSKRVWDAVRGHTKAARTQELIGCSPGVLMAHLEKQFTKGMSWSNYGDWHIDHIIPCAAFDLSDPQQQRQCFHFTNLQPLWALENMSKGATIWEGHTPDLLV